MFGNRRLQKRYTVNATAKVLHGASALDLPIRDISLSGIGLDASNSTELTVGALCLVALPSHGKLDAMVVGVRAQSLHLRFLQTDPEEVRSFIAAHGGEI
ncbi:MAG: PilZ domain-containing protein [Proteobacteria bacterium]|nr:PilZ domain-containing protein [Pseudomonadota bacterium]